MVHDRFLTVLSRPWLVNAAVTFAEAVDVACNEADGVEPVKVNILPQVHKIASGGDGQDATARRRREKGCKDLNSDPVGAHY